MQATRRTPIVTLGEGEREQAWAEIERQLTAYTPKNLVLAPSMS